MSDSLFLALILGVPVAAGCLAWSRESRKTACALWLLAALLLFAVWAPSNIGAKASAQRNSCHNNLKAIDSAAQQWALIHGKQATNTYSLSEPALLAFLKGSTLPACPGGGHYSSGANVGDSPKCSLAAKGHTL